MSKLSFEDILKNKYEGAASEVPSSIWNGLESSISTGVSSAGTTGTLSLFTKVIIGTVVAASISTVVYLSSTAENSSSEPAQTVQEPIKEYKNAKVSPASTEEETHEQPSKQRSTPTAEKQVLTVNPEIEPKDIVKEFIVESEVIEQNEADKNAIVEEVLEEQIEPETISSKETKQKEVVLPTKISVNQLSENPPRFEYSVNQSSDEVQISWYINEEFVEVTNSLTTEFSLEGNHLVMALVKPENEESYSLFKEQQIELPIVLAVPNIISPNGDAYNEAFDLYKEKSQNVASYKITILDLNSELIFQSDEFTTAWNGRLLDGTLAPVGKYLYLIEAQSSLGKTKKETGTFTLQR